MEAQAIEAVIFDMDGVLVDSEPMWRAVEREVFSRLGIDVSEEDLVETMGVPIDEVVALWHRRHPWDEPTRDEVVQTIVAGVADGIAREGLNPGAIKAVDYFRERGLRTALASSSPMSLIRAVLSVDGLGERFEVVHSAEHEERGKPEPDVYVSTARAMGVDPERCLAIEDSLNGVRSAKAAGMVCIALPETPPDDGPFGDADLVIRSLAELDDRIWSATDTVPAPRA